MPPKGWRKYKTEEEAQEAKRESWRKYRHKPNVQQEVYGPAARSWQLKNPDRMRKYYSESSTRRWQKNRLYIDRVVTFLGCQRCGYKKVPAALVFHHVDPITKNFSVRAALARSRVTLKAEMRKCIVLCCNCHNELHAQEEVKIKRGRPGKGLVCESRKKAYYKALTRRKKFVDRLRLWRGCRSCGYKRCVKALVFHHREDSIKDFSVANNLLCPMMVLKKEIRKCDILCSNCHAEAHWGNNDNS